MKLGNWECREGFGLGFLTERGFGVCGGWTRSVCGAGRVIWGCACAGRRPAQGSVCVREEGEQRVCWPLWRNWSGGVVQERSFQKRKMFALVCEEWASGCGYTRLCGK